MNDKILCIYHGNCQDGFGAAWAVRHALGDSVEFFPGVYQEPPPDRIAGRDVVLVDFSYKRPVLEMMMSGAGSARSILILDHHKSAQEDLDGIMPVSSLRDWQAIQVPQAMVPPAIVGAMFDMKRSGAGLAWDFFVGGRRPPLIDHIEDRDLWRFALPRTREISAALFSHQYDFVLWDRLMLDPLALGQLEIEGEAIERKHQQDIANLLPVVRRHMTIGGLSMPVASLPLTMTSDAGHRMASEADGVAACYWDTPQGRVFSLRSTDAGPDVAAIAQRYGGGGHAHAAGFRMPLGWEGDQ